MTKIRDILIKIKGNGSVSPAVADRIEIAHGHSTGFNDRLSGNRGAISSMMATDPDTYDSVQPTAPLRVQVQSALRNYFCQVDGHMPGNLYKMVLEQVEPPLLEAVLYYTQGNQTKAADILGINRSTLRKKLKQYGLD